MCGICGIINFSSEPVNAALIGAMNTIQKHRGPDASGIKVFGNAALGHCRLSIIDLSSGNQPLSNESGDIWVTFNGEIYNFRHLRNGLMSQGHVFSTNSDTETIVHLYEQYGTEFVGRLEGMFAFAIYDSRRKKVILARDRLGKKPLYYSLSAGFLVFASELQAVAMHPGVPRDINFQAFSDYLTLNYIPHPDTIYRHVNKLDPGHLLVADAVSGASSVERYWCCSFSHKNNMSYAEAKKNLRRLVEDAVRKRLVSDVPIGAFLSGGIDSTIVTGVMSKLSGDRISTFTIGFKEDNYDERKFARIASDRFHTRHFERVVTPEDFSVVESLVSNFGEPYADSSMIPTYLLSRFARENITVALSGDGGDEMFAGYYRYLLYRYSRIADRLPLSFRKIIFGALNGMMSGKKDERTFSGRLKRIVDMFSAPPETRYLNILSRCDGPLKESLFGERMMEHLPAPASDYMSGLFRHCTAASDVEAVMEADINSYLPCDILAKVDTASMASSLETRSPLLDHSIAEFASSIPLDFKQTAGGGRKVILTDAFSDLLPQQLLNRGKMGFGVPVGRWLRKEWRVRATDILSSCESARAGYLNQDTVNRILSMHLGNKSDFSYVLYALIVFELWYRKYLC